MNDPELAHAYLIAVKSFAGVRRYGGMMPQWLVASCDEDAIHLLLELGCLNEGRFTLANRTCRGVKLTDKGRDLLGDPGSAG